MKSRIQDITRHVRAVLEHDMASRNSDSYLYYKVCCEMLSHSGINPATITLKDACTRRDALGLPATESVRRARQKLQSENPELRGSERVTKMRAELEEEFREYARS